MLSVWFSLMGEKGNFGGVSRGRKEVTGWSGHLAGWASVAVVPLVLGKKIAFTKSFSGGKHQCLRTHWF